MFMDAIYIEFVESIFMLYRINIIKSRIYISKAENVNDISWIKQFPRI